MAGQGLERREVLRILALAAGASTYPGFSRWSFACGHAGSALLQVKRPSYTPRFFSADEYATVERLADLIIPSDGSPGAREAGVSEFIDFMVSSDPAVQYRFRYGLTWLDAHAGRLHGAPFRALDEPKQSDLLGRLAYRDRYRDGEDEGRAFFKLIREHTIMGFYTSRIGLEQLDYPGLRIYAESPGCPHAGDPEHRQLPAPKP
ncbi:MAG TPA: gluconate 2-dehydrogenase subunit 3 family protein [Vicinamibacteria bacterium]